MTEPIERTARYQDDLARLLAALEPVQRAEVLDGVREHIDAALAEVGHAPTDADVDRILGELGSPGMVVEAALAERPAAEGAAGVGAAPAGGSWREQLMGRWVPPVALLLLLVGGALMLWGFPLLLVAVGIVMVVASPLWVGREQLWAAIALPLCSSMFLGHMLFMRWRVWLGPFTPADIIGIFCTAAALVLVAVLWVRGARRARRYRRDDRLAAGLEQAS
ncbi:HAAS signaling domain-containing protein [Ruania albidiflava]|uniref:HAAS signaling domain-containing protein n=1 Tax=Ruania albidiflava TaxID=366586 RepID=UPI0003B5998C|nr:hypothetical protein [Ruania albidiflava]